MPRPKKPSPKPPRSAWGAGSVSWSEARQRWIARLPRQADGTRRESRHRTRDEAQAWIARELRRDTDAFDPSRPLGEYLNYWYALRASNWAPQTARRYRYEMAALGQLAAIQLARLRGDQVQAHLAGMVRRKLTRRYTYNVGSLLNRALADAVKWRIIPDNAMDTVTLPVPEHKPARAWDLDELRAVLAAIVGHRFEACYLLILWGGLRIGEVVALRWSQIADDGTVLIDQAEQTHMKGRPLGPAKRERVRETQLPAHVVARLKALRAAGPAPMDFPPRPFAAVAYVFVSQRPDGNRWTPRQIRDDWAALVGKVKVGEAAVRPLGPHGGRRTFGTAHMVAGTSLADLAGLLGHSSPAVTASAYLGSSAARRREAAEGLARLILGDPGTDGGRNGGRVGS